MSGGAPPPLVMVTVCGTRRMDPATLRSIETMALCAAAAIARAQQSEIRPSKPQWQKGRSP